MSSSFVTPWTIDHYRLLCPWDFPARILEWVAISFSRASSQPRDRTEVSLIGGRRFNLWATRDSKTTTDGDCSHEIKRCLLLGRKVMTNLYSILKKQRHYFVNKGLFGQSYGFSSSHVQMWESDHKESWAPKNGCLRTVVLEKTLKSPLDRKIKAVKPKGN